MHTYHPVLLFTANGMSFVSPNDALEIMYVICNVFISNLLNEYGNKCSESL
jgi:hypothetical protein